MGSSSEEAQGGFARSEDLLEILRKGKTFAEELLHENERLRFKVLQLEEAGHSAESHDVAEELAHLRAENARLHDRLAHIDERFADIESDNQDYAVRHQEYESQNEALANLYVASYQLHATLDPSEVSQAITEIITGLIGAESFAILLIDEETSDLVVVAGEHVEERFPTGRVAWGEGIEGRVAETGESVFGAAGTAEEQTACVPLMLRGECAGVIGIYRMLSQKKGGFTSVDHELLNLLAGQAATALVSSRLYAAKDRRLKTMEGFIKMLRER